VGQFESAEKLKFKLTHYRRMAKSESRKKEVATANFKRSAMSP